MIMTMMIIIVVECTKPVMHNAVAHHPLTDAQPIPEQPVPPPQPVTPY